MGKSREFRDARDRANPLEYVKDEIFQNRAALKMCEIDTLLNYVITRPPCWLEADKTRKGHRIAHIQNWKRRQFDELGIHKNDVKSKEVLHFADICAGPGGFTEYFFHVRKWRCKGFGFTLAGPEDFKLDKFNNDSPHGNFYPMYGPPGRESGDITRTENITWFTNQVLGSADGGVHVVMADGGFDVSIHYNSQELFSRQLVLCQFVTAMSILRKGGVFVCKLFDTFHPFTASLIYILRAYFTEVGLIKPNQSRPANSERYIVCKGFLLDNHLEVKRVVDEKGARNERVLPSHPVIDHLLHVNDLMNIAKDPGDAVNHGGIPREVAPLVPSGEMDKEFVGWLKKFNESNALRQTRFLHRVKKYVEDRSLRSDDQDAIRKEALQFLFKHQKGSELPIGPLGLRL